MPRFRLGQKRTEASPDRRLGIKLEPPPDKRRLGGKLDPYVPPELLYDYNPPSVFTRYRTLTIVFLVVGFGLLGYWASLLRHVPATLERPPAPSNPAAASAAQSLKDQPIYVEPLPSQ